MTHRLYYDQTYLRAFDAKVLEVRREEARALIRLDQSAFYPTSGGQPYDTGTLGGEAIRDVFVDEAGEVWHALRPETPLQAGDSVHGEIDWARQMALLKQGGYAGKLSFEMVYGVFPETLLPTTFYISLYIRFLPE